MTEHPQPNAEPRRVERAVVLQLLRDDHDERWSRAELEAEVNDVEPSALSRAIAELERRGVAVALTHHSREPLEMEGGTTFHFACDGIESALAQAKDAAAGRDVWLAGGASVVNQYLAAGLVDEIDISIAPVILGSGARLFDGVQPGVVKLEQIRAVDAPGVTHVKYEVS